MQSSMDTKLASLYHQLQGLNNVALLEHLVALVDKELEVAETQVDQYIATSLDELSNDITAVELKRLNLSTALNESSKPLATKIADANELSYSITKKIRMLDLEKDKINQAFKYIQDVILMKNEFLSTNSFLEGKNWKQLSLSINNILTQLPEQLLEDDEFVAVVVPTQDLPDMPKTTITNWITQLSDFFKQEFEKASALKDVNGLTQYFLLFPLLLQSEVGLNCYSKFIVNLVNEQATNLLTNISRDARMKPGFHSLTLLKIFEIISTIINQHSKLIVENYSSKSMLQIITRIQKECDIQSGLIFDTFWDLKNIVSVLKRVSNYDFPLLVRMMIDQEEETAQNFVEDISIIEINDLCFELATILKNWKNYCNFLKIKWDEYSGIAHSNEIPEPVSNSTFVLKIKEKIVPTFDKLSTFQLRRSVEKSFEMEELPDLSDYLLLKEVANSLVSSVIDDVILVLNNVLSRTLETGDETVIKNMVTNSKRVLEIDLIQLLSKRLQMNQPRANSSLALSSITNIRSSNEFSRDQSLSPRAGTPSNTYGGLFMRNATSAITTAMNFNKDDDLRRLETFIIYLNSVETIRVYIKKLIENLDKKLVLDKLFMHYDEGNSSLYDNTITKRIANFLDSVDDSFQQKCIIIVNSNIEILYQQVFSSKLMKLVSDLFSKPEDYLTSSSVSSEELLKFINQLKSLYQPLQKVLVPELFLKVMSKVTSNLSNMIERKILTMRFTDLGALTLEKTLSFIIGDLSKIDYKLRENFIRITQIIMVLSLDDDEEDQLFNDDENDEKLGIKWVLMPNERQRARKLRVDLEK